MREFIPFSNLDWSNPCRTTYDDIVRKDNFRPDSEVINDFNSGAVPGGHSGKYDSDGNDGFDPDSVSPELLALRSGKLDKAEVSMIAKYLKSQAEKENKDFEDKETFEAAEEASKARTEAMDSILGISS